MTLSSLTTTYRVSLEAPQDAHLQDRGHREQIKGKRGDVYLYSDTLLAVETENVRLQAQLRNHPAMVKQFNWFVYLFPLDQLGEMCRRVKARQRRQYTPEHKARMSANGRRLAEMRVRTIKRAL